MNTGWGEFIAAFTMFFVSHALPVRPAIKAWITALIGARGFTLAYSALSVAMLTWIIIAAGRAPLVVLWPLTEPARWLALGCMLAAVLLFTVSIGRPNPLSFGGRKGAFDPRNPGIIGWIRHPLLGVLFLWSVGHLIANGTLAHVILFGAFALFSLLGVRLIDRRKRRALGARWRILAAPSRRIAPSLNGVLRLAGGFALYRLLLWAHGPVIGAWPLG